MGVPVQLLQYILDEKSRVKNLCLPSKRKLPGLNKPVLDRNDVQPLANKLYENHQVFLHVH